jgi:hypothetical protein
MAFSGGLAEERRCDPMDDGVVLSLDPGRRSGLLIWRHMLPRGA